MINLFEKMLKNIRVAIKKKFPFMTLLDLVGILAGVALIVALIILGVLTGKLTLRGIVVVVFLFIAFLAIVRENYFMIFVTQISIWIPIGTYILFSEEYIKHINRVWAYAPINVKVVFYYLPLILFIISVILLIFFMLHLVGTLYKEEPGFRAFLEGFFLVIYLTVILMSILMTLTMISQSIGITMESVLNGKLSDQESNVLLYLKTYKKYTINMFL
jgi:hypothetical protein